MALRQAQGHSTRMVSCYSKTINASQPQQVSDVWQRRTGREVTQEHARQIVENLCGFVELLAEWDRRDRDSEGTEDLSDAAPSGQEGMARAGP